MESVFFIRFVIFSQSEKTLHNSQHHLMHLKTYMHASMSQNEKNSQRSATNVIMNFLY